MKIDNWTTEDKLDAMKAKGWVEQQRVERLDEDRIVVTLHHPEDKVITHRSLHL